MELTAVLTPAGEGGYVALNPETGTTTQGETVEEAVANLQEATALYLSEFPLHAQRHPLVTYRSKAAGDPECQAAMRYCEETKCFLSYERSFMRPVFE